jgi:hypothetical protein
VLLAAAGSCAVRARRRATDRLAWALLAGGLLAWTAGNAYQAVVLRAENLFSPSPADLGWLALYPLAYAGLGLLARARLLQAPRSMWLDGVTTAVATSAVGTAFVLPALEGRTP